MSVLTDFQQRFLRTVRGDCDYWPSGATLQAWMEDRGFRGQLMAVMAAQRMELEVRVVRAARRLADRLEEEELAKGQQARVAVQLLQMVKMFRGIEEPAAAASSGQGGQQQFEWRTSGPKMCACGQYEHSGRTCEQVKEEVDRQIELGRAAHERRQEQERTVAPSAEVELTEAEERRLLEDAAAAAAGGEVVEESRSAGGPEDEFAARVLRRRAT